MKRWTDAGILLESLSRFEAKGHTITGMFCKLVHRRGQTVESCNLPVSISVPQRDGACLYNTHVDLTGSYLHRLDGEFRSSSSKSFMLTPMVPKLSIQTSDDQALYASDRDVVGQKCCRGMKDLSSASLSRHITSVQFHFATVNIHTKEDLSYVEADISIH